MKRCEVDGCDKPHYAKGWCNMHWQRMRLRGTLESGSPFTRWTSAIERFEAQVERTDSCWIWRGTRVADGYGRMRSGGRLVVAHRFAYEHFVGPIPDGLQLDHLCRNRACVNPQHLEPVTHRENVLRGVSEPAVNALKTHCKRGHPFDDENTYTTGQGSRLCRECARQADRRRRSVQPVK